MSSIYIILEKRKNSETVDIWRDLTMIKFESVLIKEEKLKLGWRSDFLTLSFFQRLALKQWLHLLFKIKIVLKEKCKKPYRNKTKCS